MSGWNHLPGPVQGDILFQLPVQNIISLCQIDIFSCKEGITEFDEDNDFWKRYFLIHPYNYLKYKLKKNAKVGYIENHILIEASRLGNILAMKDALKKGADIYVYFEQAVREAATH